MAPKHVFGRPFLTLLLLLLPSVTVLASPACVAETPALGISLGGVGVICFLVWKLMVYHELRLVYGMTKVGGGSFEGR